MVKSLSKSKQLQQLQAINDNLFFLEELYTSFAKRIVNGQTTLQRTGKI